MYINTKTQQYPVSESDIRAAFPNTSFAAPFQAPEPYAWVFQAPPPPYDPILQAVRELAPVLTDKGHWEQRWDVYGLTAEQVAANQAARAQAVLADIMQRTQQRLDEFAQTRHYDGILSACTYATSAVPKFKAEGQYCVQQRDATWAALYQVLAEVEAGTRPAPTGFADVEGDLPALTWPD